MTMGYIERHGIKFFNKTNTGYVKKWASPYTDSNVGYIVEFDDPSILMEIINKLHSAINGHFQNIKDTNINGEDSIVYVTPTGVEFYDSEGQNIIDTVPLQDIYDIAVAWREFIIQPPLDGTKLL